MPIEHVKGDVTLPVESTAERVVAHIVNDAGKYGAGVSGAIEKRWPEAAEYYRKQYKLARKNVQLGCVLWTAPPGNIMIAQMVAQHGVRHFGNTRPIRYEFLEECLAKVATAARVLPEKHHFDDRHLQDVSIHMPRIGAGLAGGRWERIEGLIDEVFWDLKVFIYTP